MTPGPLVPPTPAGSPAWQRPWWHPAQACSGPPVRSRCGDTLPRRPGPKSGSQAPGAQPVLSLLDFIYCPREPWPPQAEGSLYSWRGEVSPRTGLGRAEIESHSCVGLARPTCPTIETGSEPGLGVAGQPSTAGRVPCPTEIPLFLATQ